MTSSQQEPPVPAGFAGLRVCSFESRKGAEMRSFIERHSGVATIVPSMREVPLDENPEAFAFAEALLGGQVDVLIFMTGVGARGLLEVLETRYARADLFLAMQACCVIVRGPKPAGVLREWKVRFDHHVPEPNTWRELLELLAQHVPVLGKRVAIQEYGVPNEELYQELTARGADVRRVPVYRWELPEDSRPLRESIHDTIAGRFDVLLFTSTNQLHNILAVAEEFHVREAWLEAARRCVVASIGPTATETLVAAGLPPDLEPQHPKMGHLVRETAEAARAILNRKRSE